MTANHSAWAATRGRLEPISGTASRGRTASERTGAGFTSEMEAWKLRIEIKQQSGSDEGEGRVCPPEAGQQSSGAAAGGAQTPRKPES